MSLIPNDVRKKVEQLFGQAGIAGDDQIVMQNISMTGMPQDDAMTEIFLRRCKAEAATLPEEYRCIGCGRAYDDANDVLECINDHLKDFMAGLPIDRLPEYEEAIMNKLPAEMRNDVERYRRDGLLSNESPTSEE